MRLLVLDAVAKRSLSVVAALRGCGFTPDRLDTLGEATEALALVPYTGIVLRQRFSDGDGVSWLQQCRADGMATPTVMMLDASTIEDRIQALDAGADDCIQGSVDERELVARVRAVLRRPPTLEAAVLRAGNVALDTRSREVWVGEEAVPMPRRELCLLEHLLRRFGRIVPRVMLEENLYGHADDWCANSLDVRVSRVRRQLSSAGASVAVQTVRGIGYALRAA